MNRTEKLERLLDLKVREAAYGLSSGESAELRDLVSEFPEWDGDESLELAAASIQLLGTKDEQMPAYLMKSIEDEFSRLYPKQAGATRIDRAKDEQSFTIFDFKWLGWSLAGAFGAMLLFNTLSNQVSFEAERGAPVVATVEQQFDELVASSGDVIRSRWVSPSEDKELGFEGEVVWSDSKQKGFMKFKGLPPNDKSKETYQLWIFDENQKAETPIDGGIFDGATEGELIVPIQAKLEVKNAQLFAITVEKPGGVVVSDRQRLIGLAKTKSKA
jgi:hypothetical protein